MFGGAAHAYRPTDSDLGARNVIPSLQLILTGLGIGILITAPVGPVNVLCIQRTLERGFAAGVAAGLGAVLADGLIALVATFGVTYISDVINSHKVLIQVIGGMVVLGFGLRLIFSHPKPTDATATSLADYRWTIPQTFFFTITNPGAILGLFAILGGVGSAFGGFQTYSEALTMVAAIMGGATLWWLGLAKIISSIRHHLNEGRLRLINQIAGLLLIGFGLLLLGELVFTLIFRSAG